MKKFFYCSFVCVFLSNSISFAQGNCYTPPYLWYRVINQPVYRWYWDGQLNGAAFDGYDHILSVTEKQNIVRNAIIWAVNYWKNTVNTNGIVIEDMSETSISYADFHFTFISLDGQAGATPSSSEVQLASNVIWTDNISYASANRAIDIRTIILHEMGHIFFGIGHSVNDGTSLMWNIYPGPFRYITNCDRQALFNLYPLFNITVDNNFTDNTGNGTNGKVGISGYSVNPTAPVTIKKAPGQSVTLTAISPQTNNQNYQMIWHSSSVNKSAWTRNEFFFRSDQSFPFTVSNSDTGATYQAQLRKICKINFQNSFVGIGNGGVINVNNTQYNSPTTQFNVVELNLINALPANGQILNGIMYYFSKWSDGNTTAYRTFNPSANTTYTAQYIGKPSTYDLTTGWSLNLHHSTIVGQPIILYWNEHPNSYVTKYQIWKKEKYNGVTSDPILMATVNRGTTSYVDNDFVYSLLKNKYWIYYALVPYYSLENTYSDPSWMPVTAEIYYKMMDSTYAVTSAVLENSVSNFPNPFNPTTTINFSIKDAGCVNIRVFDLIGQEVIELVNEEKEAGSYKVEFNAASLPSGVYIYKIQAGSFVSSKKMLLLK